MSETKNIYWIDNLRTFMVFLVLVAHVAVTYDMLDTGRQHIIVGAANLIILYISYILTAAYMIYSLVTIFKYHFNIKDKILDLLNSNSYGVYLIHVIVLGLIALVMVDIHISFIIKFLLLIILTYFFSNLIVFSFKKLKKVIMKS